MFSHEVVPHLSLYLAIPRAPGILQKNRHAAEGPTGVCFTWATDLPPVSTLSLSPGRLPQSLSLIPARQARVAVGTCVYGSACGTKKTEEVVCNRFWTVVELACFVLGCLLFSFFFFRSV